jgi:serine protease Do
MRNLALLSLGVVALGTVVACHGPAMATPPSTSSVTTTSAALETAASMPDVASLAAKVRPAVVNITTTHTVHAREAMSPFDFFFHGQQQGQPGGRGGSGGRDRVTRQQALGSGFIIDAAGHVVTNAHVVAGADTVKVKLGDERELDAKVKGRDERLDLAVLELQGAQNLPFVSLGDSEGLRVGEYVVAIGNPFGLGQTVTMGIVSAKSRAIGAGPYDDFIQTDASINPGNSGGPLFDVRGNVIGVNTAINPNGQGIGFAIPANALKDVLPQLLSKGHVDRGRIGVLVQPIDAALGKAMGLAKPEGALVGEVEKGGPGERAGLRPGDVITAVDGAPVVHSQELPRTVARHAPGSSLKLTVLHDKQQKTVNVTLDRLPDEPSSDDDAKSTEPDVAAPKSGELGVGLADAPGVAGAVVQRVNPNGAAHDALESGDVIVEVDKKPVKNAAEAAAAIRAAPTGQPLLLAVKREGHQRYVGIERK